MADVEVVLSPEEKKIKIMTWNINGIRAVTREKKMQTFLDELDADIICFQETKITRKHQISYSSHLSCLKIERTFSQFRSVNYHE